MSNMHKSSCAVTHLPITYDECMQDLDAVQPLAMFLAHERNKGQDSFWQPYLGLLPATPGCAWQMQPAELATALTAAQMLVGEWRSA